MKNSINHNEHNEHDENLRAKSIGMPYFDFTLLVVSVVHVVVERLVPNGRFQ